MFIYYFYILDYYNYFIKETGSYYALELSEFLLFSIYYILYLKGGLTFHDFPNFFLFFFFFYSFSLDFSKSLPPYFSILLLLLFYYY